MPDTSYTNPFQMFMQTNQPQGGVPFAQQWEGQENRDMARPFIDRLNQSEQLRLLKEKMETGEFMSDNAQQTRRTEGLAKRAEAQGKIDTIPYKSAQEVQEAKDKLRESPHITDQRIATAQETMRKAQGTPYAQLFDELGTAYPAMEHAGSEAEKAAMHQNIIQNWEAKNPGLRAPDRMRMYDPRHDADYALLHHQQLNTPDYLRRLGVGAQEQGSHERIAQGNNTTSLAVGAGHDAAHVEAVRVGREGRETQNNAIARLRRTLATNPKNEDARQELTGYLEESFDARFQKDGLGNMLQVQASSGKPEDLEKYTVYREQRKATHFMNQGLYGEVSPTGRAWVMKMIQANPHSSTEQIINAGRKTGKID